MSDSPVEIEIKMSLTMGAVARGMDALAEWEQLPDSRRTAANKVAMVYSVVRAEQDRVDSLGV